MTAPWQETLPVVTPWQEASRATNGTAIAATGPPGAVGATGAVGAQGIQGIQGLIGPGGGATGPAGPTGPPGTPGVTGATGITGSQGPVGSTGPTGFTGNTGSQGLQGIQGIDGPVGPVGPSGTGRVFTTSLTASTGAITSTTYSNILSAGATLVTGHKYRVYASWFGWAPGAAGDYWQAELTSTGTGSFIGGQQLSSRNQSAGVVNCPGASMMAVYSCTTGSTCTIALVARMISGSAFNIIATAGGPLLFGMEDIGV